MIACPNKRLKAWKDLVQVVGEKEAYSLWNAYQGSVPDEYYNTAIVAPTDSEINYGLKSVQILWSDKAEQVFEKGKKNNWDLNKILTELQIPKEQKQIILDKGITNREEIITSLLADNSFVVEINTAKERLQDYEMVDETGEGDFQPREFIPDTELVEEEDEDGNIIGVKEVLSEKGKKQIEERENRRKPTQHYSNLTVPGGTNYTENEIATPAITPSIKGHAQFSTDNGIGWFRSDDKAISQIEKREMWNPFTEQVEEYEEERGSVDPTKTRRILEVQSDLFQKGRGKKDLATKDYGLDPDFYRENFDTVEEMKEYEKTAMMNDNNSSQNQFLQLLNKDNNWVTFFIKSIIQDSAKKGYEKVLFPKGDTAAKIEGHQTLEEFKKEKLRLINLQEEALKVAKNSNIEVDLTYGGYKLKLDKFTTITGKATKEELETERKKYIENHQREVNHLRQELADVESGKTQLSSIAKFYEETITNILKKNGFNPVEITDEYGNKWNEVEVTQEAIKPIWFSKSPLEDELKAVLDYFKMTKRERLHQPQLAKSLQIRINAVNKRLGYEGLVFKQYYKGKKLYMRVGINTTHNSTELNKLTNASYSRWFNSLTAEQKRSENALRVQDGLPELKVSRQKVSPLASESTEKADEKIAILQKIFDVEVEYDTSLDAAGAVLPGTRPKIVINPDRLKEDTVIHEFAHIFIDALGGLNNSLVSAAVNKLRGTDLWNEVKQAYPELDDTNLAKEVLATAMGRRGNEIFNDEVNQSWWNRFVTRIIERIASWFKRDPNEIDSLIRQMFSTDSAKLNLISNDIVQFSKTPEEAFARQRQLDAEQQNVEQMSKKALNTLKTKHKIISASPSASEGYSKYQAKLIETINDIEKVIKTSPILGLHKFVEYARLQLGTVEKTIKELSQTGTSKLSSELVNQIDLFSGVFENIKDYVTVLENNAEDLEKLGIPTKELKLRLDDLLSNETRTKENLKDAKRRVAAFEMAKESNYSQGLARQRFEVEANKAGLKGVNKEKYIHEQMIANQDKFFVQNVDFYYNMLKTTLNDISGFEAWALDPTNINSRSVQVLQSIINKAQFNVRNNTLREKAKIAAALEKFTKGAYTPSKLFKNLTVQGSDGIWYLRGEYDIEFNVQLKNYEIAVNNAINDFGFNSPEHNKAVAARKQWLDKNTTKKTVLVGSKQVLQTVPSEKWRDKTVLTAEEIEFLEFAKKTLKDQDSRVPKHKRLIKRVSNKVINDMYQLPGVEQKTSEVLVEKGIFKFVKEGVTRLVKRSETEEEFGELQSELEKDQGYKEVFTYESGEEKKDIPVFYRTQPKNQSLDLPTLLTMNSYTTNNFKYKYTILPKISILLDATADKRIGKSEGTGLKKLLMSKSTQEPITFLGRESKEYQVMQSMVEDTIFGVSTIDLHSTILGADVNTLLSSLGRWTADSMLIFNYLSAGANVIQGKTMNLLELKSQGALTKGLLRKGDSRFWADSRGWLDDVGRATPKSKTSLLMDMFNIKGDYSNISTHFFKNSKAAALASWEKAHFLNGIGEYYTAGTLMYSLLSDVKLMNNKKQFIDINGNVVDTKDKAASLADAYIVENGKLTIDPKYKKGTNAFTYTTFDYENTYSPATISNYIKKVYSDLHGQYDNGLQSMAQRHAVMKLVFMLRKWILPGMLRRYRGISTALEKEVNPQDKFYSEALMKEMEGNYTTAIRFIVNIKRSMQDLKFDLAFRTNWNELNDHERANIRRTVMELSIMTMTLASSLILRNLAKNMDDDDEVLKGATMLTTFWTRRLYSELSFYVWPPEQIRILRSPAASVSMLESSFRLLGQIQRDIIHMDENGDLHAFEFERYERGPRKGDPKLIKKVEQVLPIFKNIKRDVEDATDYLWNSF